MRIFRYIRNPEIDRQKWDERVSSARNGLVYAYSWFLDHMSPGWDALVAGDYEYIMPLTWRKKFAISYLYQPAFAAQLGLFGDNISSDMLLDLVSSIPAKFRLIEISMNEGNLPLNVSGSQYSTNYLLDLNKTSAVIRQNFRAGTSRRIIQSKEAGNRFALDVPVEDILELMLMKMSDVSNINSHDAKRFHDLFTYAQPIGFARTFGVYNRDGMLLSSTVILQSHQRVYYLMAGNRPEGRKSFASHHMLDGILHHYAASDKIFDFEGSDIPGVAMFYENFGAHAVQYPKLRINRLPAVVNWLRRLS